MSAWGKMHMRNRKWTDLPTDLVSYIADRLGIIELLSFRSVCKAWNSASSSASAKMESKPDFEPWFLLYGSDDECQLMTESGEKYTMCLPQMDGTTCIASNHGWLLLFQQGGSMFFFRPFSKTKIDLPKFPASELSGHVAAFSSPPNSRDCTVCVVSRSNDEELELNLLHRGANEWIQVQHKHERHINTIKCAAYYREQFYFFDDRNKMLIFRTEDLSWKHRWLVSCASKEKSPTQFYYRSAHWQSNDIKKLGLEEDVSISTCGTQSQYHDIGFFVFNETITGKQVEGSESRQYKGVWIYPRICQTAPKDESW